MASIRRRNGKYQVQIRVGHYSRSQSFHKLNDAKSWARKEEELAEQRRYLGSKYEPCNLAEILVRYLKDVTPHKRSCDTELIVLQTLLKEALAAANPCRAHLHMHRAAPLAHTHPCTECADQLNQ